MLICPNGHGEWPTKYHYCPECQAKLIAMPAEEGDQVNIRSPKQTVVVNTAPTAHASPTHVVCPRCGRKSLDTDTFDCVGPCGRQHLCLRHFDEEYELCKDCGDEKRGLAQQEAARQAQLYSDLQNQKTQVRHLTTELAQVTTESNRAQGELAETRARLLQAQEDAVEWQAKVAALEKSLSEWRARGEKAEGQLAQIARRERDAEAVQQAESATACDKVSLEGTLLDSMAGYE